MTVARPFPEEVYQIAQRYGLGTPEWRHSRDGKMLDFLFATLLISSGLFLIALLLLQATLTPDMLILVLLVLAVALVALWSGINLLMRWSKNLDYCAYECSRGFIELYKGKKLLLALHWDEISKVQMVQRKWSFGTQYYFTHRQGQVIPIYYFGIWGRCQEEIQQRPHTKQWRVW